MDAHRRRLPAHGIVCGLCLVLSALGACSGQSVKDPDGDDTKERARAFSHLGPTEDRLDAAGGDVEDWRFFLSDKPGQKEIRVSVGKWKESTITGFVTVFSKVGDIVAERPLPSGGRGTVQLRFEVKGNIQYLVRFKATSGKGEYAVEVGEPVDACAACTPKQDCIEQKCVDKPCGGGCDEGMTCDRTANRCIGAKRSDNKCDGVSCPRGETCSRATGKCAAPAAAAPKCGTGEVLKDGECVSKDNDIDCTVIDVREAGGGSVLTLSAGDNKGVHKGSVGSIKGLRGASFTVIEVYPSRSKAMSKLAPAKFTGNTAASIKR